MSGWRIHHVALWTRDLDRMREFYVSALGGRSGPPYENLKTGFRSYFIVFGEGAHVELMFNDTRSTVSSAQDGVGYVHLALSVGGREAVDETVERLRGRGVRILGEPRITGDGYYEAVIEDPDGNQIELVE